MTLTIVLDNIRSAWNVGAIMRTCDALGAKLILVGYTPKPVGQTLNLIKKTAIGAENTVEWEGFEMDNQVLEKYNQSTDVHIAIELSEKSHDIFEFMGSQTRELKDKNVFLWFGNEIHGVQQELMDKLDYTVHLPMHGSKESLNVSSCACATGYLFLGIK